MNKHYKFYVAGALFVASLLPVATNAAVSAEANTTVNVSTSASAPAMPPIPANLPPEIRAKLEAAAKARLSAGQGQPGRPEMMGSTTRPGIAPLRAEMRGDIKDARQDLRDGSSTRPVLNQIRQEVRQDLRDSSTTRPMIREAVVREIMMTPLMKKFASTTMGENMIDRLKEYKQDAKQTRLDVFAAKQNQIVEELTKALNNLKEIRTRISARIDKETAAGRDLTEAKGLLVTADTKITAADAAIQALASYTPPAALTSAAINASSTVDLGKPRQIGADAIKAVNDARAALNDVVRSIAKALGVTLPPPPSDRNNASSTNQ